MQGKDEGLVDARHDEGIISAFTLKQTIDCTSGEIGGQDQIETVDISDDNKHIASNLGDKGTLAIWDLSTGKLEKKVTGHSKRIWSVAIWREGNIIVTGSVDQMVAVWKLGQFPENPARTLTHPYDKPTHAGPVRSVAISEGGGIIASGSDDGMLKIWQTQTGILNHEMKHIQGPRAKGDDGSVSCVHITKDDKFLLSGGGDKKINLWDIESGALYKTFKGHQFNISSLDSSKDGQFLVSGAHNYAHGEIILWELETGQISCHLYEAEENDNDSSAYLVSSVKFTENGKTVVAAVGKNIIVWDLEKREKIATLTGHKYPINCVAASQDGRFIISGANDGTIKIWEKSSLASEIESARISKLKKIVQVSKSLKIPQMAKILNMDEDSLYDRIIDWAAEFGFTIDQDVVEFGTGRKEDFISALSGAFADWGTKTDKKEGKLE